MLRAIVGSASITSDFTFDAVPARDVSMTGAAALTVIVSLPVVSVCAIAGRANTTSALTAQIAHPRRDHFMHFIAYSCSKGLRRNEQFYLAGYDRNAKKGCQAKPGSPGSNGS